MPKKKQKSKSKSKSASRAAKPAKKSKRGGSSARATGAKRGASTKAKTKASKSRTKIKAKSSVAKSSPRSSKKAANAQPERAPRPKPKGRPLSREFLFDLAKAVRKAVAPAIEAGRGRDVVGNSPSGDATFELDRIAEKALLVFLKNAKKPVAYYSEDAGYTTFTTGQPSHLLVVDPIDGTRAARCGFENCTVSVASTRVIERPTVGDLDNACVMEILGNRAFYGERDQGARLYVNNHSRKIKLSDNDYLESVSWSLTVPGRPAELIFPTAAQLIDVTSLRGGFFECNSSSYSLTRLLTGQLDACVDFANRFYRDMPKLVEDAFVNAGRGFVLGVCPYDFAGALLIVEEAGCTVTDAYGEGFDEVLLLDSSVANHRTIVAAANESLHEKLLTFFDTRIRQVEAAWKRRARESA